MCEYAIVIIRYYSFYIVAFCLDVALPLYCFHGDFWYYYTAVSTLLPHFGNLGRLAVKELFVEEGGMYSLT